MKRVKLFIFCILISMQFAVNAGAVESLVETVATGCEVELKTYCSEVTFGEGRILACLYAHNDKI